MAKIRRSVIRTGRRVVEQRPSQFHFGHLATLRDGIFAGCRTTYHSHCQHAPKSRCGDLSNPVSLSTLPRIAAENHHQGRTRAFCQPSRISRTSQARCALENCSKNHRGSYSRDPKEPVEAVEEAADKGKKKRS
jgi:hypothetical protein